MRLYDAVRVINTSGCCCAVLIKGVLVLMAPGAGRGLRWCKLLLAGAGRWVLAYFRGCPGVGVIGSSVSGMYLSVVVLQPTSQCFTLHTYFWILLTLLGTT
jgi:hypothetical protein